MDNLVEIYKNIISGTIDPDQYVSNIYGHFINSPEARLKKLKSHNTLMSKFLDGCIGNGLDIYISGSVSIWSILASTNFYPNDVDIYIKEITHDKIILFESMIKSLTDNDVMIIYRPLYINFVIINTIEVADDDTNADTDEQCCHANLKTEPVALQLSTIYFRHIVEIFASYHSGIVCSAYSSRTNNFVYMREKFGSTIVSNLTGLNISRKHFDNIIIKYRSRGFVSTAFFDANVPNFGDIFSVSPNDHSLVSGNIPCLRITTSQIRTSINYDGYIREYTNGKQGRYCLFQYFMCDLNKVQSMINDIKMNNKCIYPSVHNFISDIEFLDSKFLFTNIVNTGQSDHYISYYTNLNNTCTNDNLLYCYICKQYVCDVNIILPRLEQTKLPECKPTQLVLDDYHLLRNYVSPIFGQTNNVCKKTCIYDKNYGIVPKPKKMYGGKR